VATEPLRGPARDGGATFAVTHKEDIALIHPGSSAQLRERVFDLIPPHAEYSSANSA